ncbi:hypothetical protein GGS24DRAFT_500891 [Hypoxylon argillaceum]|nr:hypothetical protein GGS24DRAFT_500891 [Hypoxylon argillaceum]KAI1154543.1 hypothetical protein F4825DRAFT_448448 [Nemania diffusa]
MSGWMSFAGKSVQESRELLGLEVQGGSAASDEIYRNTPVLITHSADERIRRGDWACSYLEETKVRVKDMGLWRETTVDEAMSKSNGVALAKTSI